MIEDHTGEQSSRLAVGLLVVLHMLPSVLASPVGGILADRFDRKMTMIMLDCLGAAVSLIFVLSLYFESIVLLFVGTVLQTATEGLYEPSRSAIIPQLVSKSYLPKATTLSGLVWSSMTAIGASLSGFIVAVFGLASCFWIDCVTYLISALLLCQVEGKFSVSEDPKESPDDKGSSKGNDGANSGEMIRQSIRYVCSSEHGAWVLIKGCGALIFGASDVIAVVFSETAGQLSSYRLGVMFGAVGVGCSLGPRVMDKMWSGHEEGELEVLQRACTVGYGVVGVGYLAMSLVSERFWALCLSNGFRASGTAVLWIDSSLILQSTTPDHIMGRVMAIDFALATSGEAVSALVAGYVLDRDVSASTISAALGIFGLLLCGSWSIYTRIKGPVCNSTNGKIEAVELYPLTVIEDT